MDALLVNAGSWASISGVVISTVGLIATIYVAWGARSASRAAEKAATATNDRIESHLQSVDLERAIALIQRIKLLHDTERWEAALEQYQSLRMMLSDIIARSPEDQPELRINLARPGRLSPLWKTPCETVFVRVTRLQIGLHWMKASTIFKARWRNSRAP
jgi:hypothetical protein